MDIVCCTDTHYIMPTGVMLKSLFDNNKTENLTVHVIIDDSVTESDKRALTEITEGYISFYSASSIHCGFPNIGVTNTHVTTASYYRLFLTQLLPVEIEKVLYLDGDIIINDNLSDLWETNIENYAIGCIKDMDEIPNLNRVSYPRDYGYFNAGVLLINLKFWRHHHLLETFLQCIKENGTKLMYHDQDVLNFTLYDKKRYLPMRYNVQNGFLFKKRFQLFTHDDDSNDLKVAQQHPAIIHYTLSKPWKQNSVSPFKRLFRYYKNQTAWSIINDEASVNTHFHNFRQTIKLLLKYKTSLLIKSFLYVR